MCSIARAPSNSVEPAAAPGEGTLVAVGKDVTVVRDVASAVVVACVSSLSRSEQDARRSSEAGNAIHNARFFTFGAYETDT